MAIVYPCGCIEADPAPKNPKAGRKRYAHKDAFCADYDSKATFQQSVKKVDGTDANIPQYKCYRLQQTGKPPKGHPNNP